MSVGRSDRGHLSPLLSLLPDAILYEWHSGPLNTPFEVATAAALAESNFAHQYQYRPCDLVVIFGDRWEQLAAATAAMIMGIPIVHLHAGERTEAVIDDACRAAISAMATIHVAANRVYASRLRGQGYPRVYALGAPGLARLKPAKPDPELETILVVFHPETKNLADIQRQARELVQGVGEFDGFNYLLPSMPGMDAGRDIIAKELAWLNFGPPMTDDEWLDELAGAYVIVGNSSCGIIEAPSIPLATVNIGDRQKGRQMASSVINVPHDRAKIRQGIELALDPEWRLGHLTGVNPYGDRHAAERIAEMLTTVRL